MFFKRVYSEKDFKHRFQFKIHVPQKQPVQAVTADFENN